MAEATSELQIKITARDMASGVFGRIGKSVGGTLGGIGRTAGGLLKTFVSLKGLLIGGIGLYALKSAFGAVIGPGMEFESVMSNVQAVARATPEAMEGLRSVAKELGRDTAFSARQAGEGMEVLSRAGFSVREVMETIPGVLDLAAAGKLGLADAADIASNSLRGFNLDTSQTGRVMDVLAMTASSSNTTVGDLGETFKYLAPVAASAGISLEDTAAAVGVMANAGIRGSMAGTQMAMAISQMLNPTEEAQKIVGRLGISFTDMHGSLIPIPDVLDQLRESGASTSDILTIFGERAGRGMAAMVGQGAEAVRDLRDKLQNCQGVAKEMAEVQLDNLKGSITILKSSMEGLWITVSDGVQPGLRGLIDNALIPGVNSLNEWISSVGGVSGALSMAGEMAGAVGSWLKENFFKLFTDWEYCKAFLENLAELGKGAIELFGGLMFSLGDIVLSSASVIWAPLAAVFATVMSNVAVVMKDAWNRLQEDVIEPAINAIITAINVPLKVLDKEIGKVDFSPLTLDVKTDFEYYWGESGKIVRRELGGIGEKFADMASQVAEDAGEMGDTARAGFEAMGGAQLREDLAAIREKYEGLKEPVEEASEAIRDGGAAAKEAAADTRTATREMHTAWGDFFDAAEAGWGEFIRSLPTWKESVSSAVKSMGESMQRTLSDTFFMVLKGDMDDLEEAWRNWKDAVLGIIADAFAEQTMKRLIGPGINAILDGLGSIIGKSNDTGNALSSIGSAVGLGGGGAGIPGVGAAVEAVTGGVGGVGGLGGVAGGVASIAAPLAVAAAAPFVAEALGEAITELRGVREWALTREELETFTGMAQQGVDAARAYEGVFPGSDMPIGADQVRMAAGALGRMVTMALGAGLQAPEPIAAEMIAELGRERLAPTRIVEIGEQVISAFEDLLAVIPTAHAGLYVRPGEIPVIAQEGEAILSRRGVAALGGEGGFERWNRGEPTARAIEMHIHINAIDSQSVEDFARRQLGPILRDLSLDGEDVIYSTGVTEA